MKCLGGTCLGNVFLTAHSSSLQRIVHILGKRPFRQRLMTLTRVDFPFGDQHQRLLLKEFYQIQCLRFFPFILHFKHALQEAVVDQAHWITDNLILELDADCCLVLRQSGSQGQSKIECKGQDFRLLRKGCHVYNDSRHWKTGFAQNSPLFYEGHRSKDYSQWHSWSPLDLCQDQAIEWTFLIVFDLDGQ